mgnify:FL=1
MAFLEFTKVRIAGLSAGVPKNIMRTVSTTDKYGDEEFIKTTGVRQKRYSNDLTTSDLCQAAAEQLISDLSWDKSEIDALIFVSQTPDYILPATSCILQDKLGLKKDCMALDISLGCSGWVYGLCTMSGLMQAGTIRKALLLAGDARKQAYEEPDQLFGFAGTVTALEYTGNEADSFKFNMGTDGSGYDAIIKPVGGTRNQVTADDLVPKMCEDGRMRHGFQTQMKGMDVFAFGITTAPKTIKKLAEHYGFDWTTYDYFVFHQANHKMNETIRTKLKLSEEKVPYSMMDYGNTSSASIPLTIVTQLKDKLGGGKNQIHWMRVRSRSLLGHSGFRNRKYCSIKPC